MEDKPKGGLALLLGSAKKAEPDDLHDMAKACAPKLLEALKEESEEDVSDVLHKLLKCAVHCAKTDED